MGFFRAKGEGSLICSGNHIVSLRPATGLLNSDLAAVEKAELTSCFGVRFGWLPGVHGARHWANQRQRVSVRGEGRGARIIQP